MRLERRRWQEKPRTVRVFSRFTVHHAAACLMGGKDQYLGDLDMGWGRSGIEGHIGNIRSGERPDALIDFLGTCIITVETDVGEMRLHQAGLHGSHTHSRMGKVDAQSVAEGFHGGLHFHLHRPHRLPQTRY